MSEQPYGQDGPAPGGQQPMMPQGDPNAYQQFPPQQFPPVQYPTGQYQSAMQVPPATPMFTHPWFSKLVMFFGIAAGVGLLLMLAQLGGGGLSSVPFLGFLVTVGSGLFEKGLLGLVATLILQGVWFMVDRNRTTKE